MALRACGVGKCFSNGNWGLRGANLEVQEGETVALVGESGSGKTTLLRLFHCLERPTEGEIFINGESSSELDPLALRRATGYIQQDGGLLPHWTVYRNVGLVAKLQGQSPKDYAPKVERWLDSVGLNPRDYGHRYPRELSGGQRQRVALARAMATDPKMVFLDEPFGALDPLIRSQLQEQFLSFKKKLQKTMVVVTHDLKEALLLGDRLAVFKGGAILQVGTGQELKKNPATPYVENLLAHHGP